MEMNTEQHGDVTVISLVGELDSTTSPDATTYIEGEIEGGSTTLVLDLTGLTYLSSAGLRVILGAGRAARTAGGDTRLAIAEGNIQKVAEMAGFAKIMKTFLTAEEAVESFAE